MSDLTHKRGICRFCGKERYFYTKDTCHTCYDKHIRGKKICKKCHKLKYVVAHGLCKQCYNKEKNYPIYKYIDKYKNGVTNWPRFIATKHHKIKCLFCDEKRLEMLDVHHIDKNRRNNKPENLVFLCPNHHREVHLGLRHITQDNYAGYCLE